MQVLEQPRQSKPVSGSLSYDRVGAGDVVTSDEARAELARVIGSPDFPATPRNRRFLSFVVEHGLLKGGNNPVKAKEIAVKVFGRAENFHPTVDAIVRIEASKLRRDLETYYLKSGKRNPVRIEIPRGGYDAVFVRGSGEDAGEMSAVPVLTGNHVEDVSAELHRVLESRDFPATERNRKFLAYIVQRELDGAPQEISPKHVATRVFGRRPTFDPVTDPIVRIEAGRLRRDLEFYYLKSGSRNPLRITIPKGAYRPVFVTNP
jgi:hypothetical protein